MSLWREPPRVEVPRSLQATVGGHPLVAETLFRRGITDSRAARAFLDPRHYTPAPPSDLPGATRAAERLEHAISKGETIGVWGDFDVDGQTATTVLVSTLRDLGATVRFHIPKREPEGHGVNLPVLRRLLDDDLGVLLTCDTGITAHRPVAYANSRGVDVVITDHHDLLQADQGPDLPPAHAVMNPKMLPQTHVLHELPGVGVAYELAQLLYERAGRAHNVLRHLDLVALGIVADVATQTGDVRYLLQRGLEALRQTERLGLQVLIELAELQPQWLTEEHIGFELAPRLNALGRLAYARPAVELLTTHDLERARILAHELDGLNARRKMMCDQVTQAAEAQIERDPSLLEQSALVLSHASWPGGIIGIVAGRLAERYHRPTILFSAPPDQPARGSARSVAGCDINAAIAAHADMLEGFGGHPMAAGLSIDPHRIPAFRRALSRTVERTCGDVLSSEPALQIDGYVPLEDINLQFVDELERLAPFGPGNPLVTLATRGLTLSNHTAIGRTGEHLKLTVQDNRGTTRQVLWWRSEAADLPRGPFDMAYTVRASDYQGQRNVQLEWIDAHPVEDTERIQSPIRRRVEVVDYRDVQDPRDKLESLRVSEGVIVWSEGPRAPTGIDRYDLTPSDSLVIWTTPPGGPELRDALAQVSPQVVYLFAVDPGLNRPRDFLVHVARLAKRSLAEKGGSMDLPTLASATAQREETALTGLNWLQSQGHVVVIKKEKQEIRIAPGDGSESGDSDQLAEQLRALMEETAAYRSHVARTEAEVLINNALSD